MLTHDDFVSTLCSAYIFAFLSIGSNTGVSERRIHVVKGHNFPSLLSE